MDHSPGIITLPGGRLASALAADSFDPWLPGLVRKCHCGISRRGRARNQPGPRPGSRGRIGRSPSRVIGGERCPA